MAMNPAVLILTHPQDVHADAVDVYLKTAHVDVYRLDTSILGSPDAPVTALIKDGAVTGTVGGCALERIVGVWHRRPSDIVADRAEDRAELRAGIGGVLAALPYLNRPVDMVNASLKPYQLAVAGRCGLSVPASLVSSDRSAAQEFELGLDGGVVVKAMSREVGGLVAEEDRSGWSRAMHLTQSRIEAAYHVRLTVVDGQMFAARIDTAHLDWRRDMDRCGYSVAVTPPGIVRAVVAVMGQLRLRFAAFDFAVDAAGRWWFLEINSNGQWLWIEQATGLPIAAAIATALQN
jgi:hypothetical protein